MPLKKKTHDNEKAERVRRAPHAESKLDAKEHERPLNLALALKRASVAPPSALRPADILALQRTVGNRAVSRLLTGQRESSQASESESRKPIQAKLTIGAAGDKYEQEADRVARQVMSMDARPSEPSLQCASGNEEERLQVMQSTISITSLAQRHVEAIGDEEESVHMRRFVERAGSGEGFEAGSEVESSIARQRSKGDPLPKDVRDFMEPRFGADFSRVKMHTDGESDQLNRSLHAHAFTTGHHIFFKRGDYNPSSSSGRALIAHELAHVLQQNGWMSEASAGQRQPMFSKEDGGWPLQRKIEDKDKPQTKFSDTKTDTEEQRLSFRNKLFEFYLVDKFIINGKEKTIDEHIADLKEDKAAKIDIKEQEENWWKFMDKLVDAMKDTTRLEEAKTKLDDAVGRLQSICGLLNRWEAEKKQKEQKKDDKKDTKGEKKWDLNAMEKGDAHTTLLFFTEKYTGSKDTKSHKQHGTNFSPKTNKQILTNILDAQTKANGPTILEKMKKDFPDFNYNGNYR